MNNQVDELGELIESFENYVHALQMPLPPEMHVECLRAGLPDLLRKFEDLYDTFLLIVGERGE